jgi:hypothetical protein
MDTETLNLISTSAGQILRTKAIVMKSRDSVERSQRLIKASMVRCEKRKCERQTGGIYNLLTAREGNSKPAFSSYPQLAYSIPEVLS